MSMSSVVILATDATSGRALAERLRGAADAVVWLDRLEHAAPTQSPELVVGEGVRLHELVSARALWPDAALALHDAAPTPDVLRACARLGIGVWDGEGALPSPAAAPWRPAGEGLLCAARLARGDAVARLAECLGLLVERWGADAAAYVVPEPGEARLEVIAQVARDRLLVCLPAVWDASWRALSVDPFGARLWRGRPERGAYPGCEPLWHRLGAGEVALLHVQPARAWSLPAGVLVVASLDAAGEVPLGRALALARALELGRALDPHPEAATSPDAEALLDALTDPITLARSNLSVLGDYAEALALCGRRMSRAALAHTGPPTPMHEVWHKLAHDEGLHRTLEDLEPLVAQSVASLEIAVAALRAARHHGPHHAPLHHLAPEAPDPLAALIAAWRRPGRAQTLTTHHAATQHPLPFALSRALARAIDPLATIEPHAETITLSVGAEGDTARWSVTGVLPPGDAPRLPEARQALDATAAALERLGGALEIDAASGALGWRLPVGASEALDD